MFGSSQAVPQHDLERTSREVGSLAPWGRFRSRLRYQFMTNPKPTGADTEVRRLRREDLEAVNEIYNHFVAETHFTFDLEPIDMTRRHEWFESFAEQGPYQAFAALLGGQVVGWVCSHSLRPRPAYRTSVETTIYLAASAHRRGFGSNLYQTLFEALRPEKLHRAYAGIALPNEASCALHQRVGFAPSASSMRWASNSVASGACVGSRRTSAEQVTHRHDGATHLLSRWRLGVPSRQEATILAGRRPRNVFFLRLVGGSPALCQCARGVRAGPLLSRHLQLSTELHSGRTSGRCVRLASRCRRVLRYRRHPG